MNVSSREEQYEHHRSHFVQRLLERYNISITDQEYDELVKKKPGFKYLYKLNTVTSLCVLEIKGTKVWCLTSRKNLFSNAALKTVLNPECRFPVPKKLSLMGVTSEEFTKHVDDFIKRVDALSETYRNLGQEQFYKTIQEDSKLKKAAKDYVRLGAFEINIAVRYVTEQIFKTCQNTQN
jgi:hypothetical protein